MSSNEMTERVARAIAEVTGQGWTQSISKTDLKAAKAAITAMRSPTEDMDDAGYSTGNSIESPNGVTGIWQAMIDSALESKE